LKNIEVPENNLGDEGMAEDVNGEWKMSSCSLLGGAFPSELLVGE
jgi:hypothetical protein